MAKTQLGLTEDIYRDMLASVGVSSSRDLDPLQFDELMRRFQAAGFKSKVVKVNGKRKSRPRSIDGKEPMMKKIGALLADAGLPWSYADAMAQKMFGVGSVRWCNPTQLWKVTAALSIYQKRQNDKKPK